MLKLDGDELETHYRHTLEELGKRPGMLGVIFRKAQNKIQDQRPTNRALRSPATVLSQPKISSTRMSGMRSIASKLRSQNTKTTLARIIAAQGADPFFISELDSSDLTVAALKTIEDSMSLCAWGDKGGRAYIVNEAHGLRKDVIRQLLVLLERLPGHCAVLFTTTREGEKDLFDDQIDAHPLLSRCIEIRLTKQGLAQPFAERARQIAQAEGLDGQPEAAYLALGRRLKNNMRAMLQAIESGEMVE